MTAIQGMSKTKGDQEFDPADRLGRIGWEDSSFPWGKPGSVLTLIIF